MNPIVSAALALLRGELPGEPKAGGYCLQLVRIVVEHAYNWPSHDLYARFLTHKVERSPGSDNDPWANDLLLSLERAGLTIPVADAQPGDLLFNERTAKNAQGDYVGHVSILLDGGLQLENVNPASRPGSLTRGPTILSKLGTWKPSHAARLKPPTTPAADRLLLLHAADGTELDRIPVPPGADVLLRVSPDGRRFWLRFDERTQE